MMKLVRVQRTEMHDIALPRGFTPLAELAWIINSKQVDTSRESYLDAGEWFQVSERDLDVFVSEMARRNPGKDIEVYNLTQVCVCPAGAMISKRVTEDGVLPD